MDTATLRTFITIADKQSFSLAAEALYLTQPAVSKRIISLESELGVRLFDRIGRQVQLTEAGLLFHNKAQSVLQQLEDIVIQIENLAGDVTGNLRLGMSHHIGLHHMPPVLHHFSKQYPQVNLELMFLKSETACARVLAGDIEIAVVTLPDKNSTLLQSKLVWTDTLKLVLANDHASSAKLRSANTSISEKFDILQHISAVLPQPGTYTRKIIEIEFQKRQLKIRDRLATNYLETIKMMVKVGLGWSVLPNTMLDKDITAIDLGDLTMSRKLGIVWHRRRTLSNAANKMIEIILE